MSEVEVRLLVFDSPERALSLFTVRAAISLARLSLSPRFLALSLMCSYCRSRLGLDPRGMVPTSLNWLFSSGLPGTPEPTRHETGRARETGVRRVGEHMRMTAKQGGTVMANAP